MLSLGFSMLFSACESHSPSSRQFNPKSGELAFRGVGTDGIFLDSRRASRTEVLAFLRSEGILSSGTRVVSADWKPKLNKWLVILRHPSGVASHWFVDAPLRNYEGGTCTQ